MSQKRRHGRRKKELTHTQIKRRDATRTQNQNRVFSAIGVKGERECVGESYVWRVSIGNRKCLMKVLWKGVYVQRDRTAHTGVQALHINPKGGSVTGGVLAIIAIIIASSSSHAKSVIHSCLHLSPCPLPIRYKSPWLSAPGDVEFNPTTARRRTTRGPSSLEFPSSHAFITIIIRLI